MSELWEVSCEIDEDETFYLNADFVQQTAKSAFGINYLYPWQRLVIANILDAISAKQKSAELERQLENGEISRQEFEEIVFDQDGACRGNQIVLLPTGAGKSMCFLVPAIIISGVTLILYPLLALMSDQERRMIDGGINSVIFRGGQTQEEREENFRRLKDKNNPAKVIIANPEVLQNEKLLERLATVGIEHIAIDEAHCVSEWGDTFRPTYTTLGKIIKKLNSPVVTAFTATASCSVLERIAEILFEGQAHILRSESDRPNIHYHVFRAEAKEKAVVGLVEKCEKPLIVFCSSRKRTEKMARIMGECFGRDKVKFYHAGLERKEKTKIEKWFFSKSDAILCATCAYGMGVDKKDIKTVIHLDVPPTAESYIQEAGRGGRDGSVANAILVWSQTDSEAAKKFQEGSRGRVLSVFAETTSCRRQVLLDALGGEQAVCSGCDNCDGTSVGYAEDAKNALKIICRNDRFLDFDECSEKIKTNFNDECVKKHKIRYWEICDAQQILNSLIKQNKIKICKFPWKNKVGVVRQRFDSKV